MKSLNNSHHRKSVSSKDSFVKMKTPKPETGKPRNSQQLVASSDTPKLGTKGRRSLKVKFNFENVAPNSKKLSPGSRQTVLSEYFKSPDASPKEPPKTEPPQKMVNVPRLLSQLLRARVVLSRLPAAPTKPQSITNTTTVSDQRDLRTGRAVQRYCHKCRVLEVDRHKITKRKICRRCGTLLLFICAKCNSRHFMENRHMTKHFLQCDGRVADGDPLDSVVLRFCNDCSFKTSYEYVMDKHLKSTGHRMMKGERTFDAEKMGAVHGKEQKDQSGRFLVIRSTHLPEKGIRRYCRKCKAVVPGSRTVNEDKCETCKTQLLYLCSKCKLKTDTYKNIYYHVRTRCYPMVFGCPKCQYTAPFRANMYKHLEMHKKGGHGRPRFKNNMKKKIEI